MWLWERVLGSLELELPNGRFRECLRSTVAVGYEAGTLVVEVASVRAKELLEMRLQERVGAALREAVMELVHEVVHGVPGVQEGGGGGLIVGRVEWRVRKS